MKTSEEKIIAYCDYVKAVLISKNKKYGDSALHPLRIFSNADANEQLRVRIDDKINRIKNQKQDDEDAILDLIGYLILYQVSGLPDE